jgi:two-component system, LytTR family, response regulator LytT
VEPLKILIVEDELIIAEDLRMQLINLGYLVTDTVISYNEAIQSIMENLPDLVMLDVRIEGPKDGIELGHFLNNEVEIPFIYLTSHSDKLTVTRAVETHPSAFLLKPFKPDSLYVSIETAFSNLGKKYNTEINEDESVSELLLKDCFFIKKDHRYIKVRLSEVYYLQSDGNYIEIVSKEGKYLIRSTIKNLTEYLPIPDFFQIHKSYIVNLHFIDAVSLDEIEVAGYKIPLSKNRRDMLLNQMKTFS